MAFKQPSVVRPLRVRQATIRSRNRLAIDSGKLIAPPNKAAMRVFWLLTAINFINYLDRIVFASIGPELKKEFMFSDAQVGLTGSAFLLVYTVAALPMGLLADRVSRTRIIAIGVILWSLATWYTAIAHTFFEIFAGRAVLGIGEASYVPAGTALLAAYFAPGERARVLSRWGASTLVGTAAGFLIGGIVAQALGWRWCFVIAGPPGLFLAWLAWQQPDRRYYDRADRDTSQAAISTKQNISMWQQARMVLSSPTVRIATIIQALGLFVVTPSIIFVPIYLREHHHLSILQTSLLTGGILIPGGIAGTLLGGVIADRLQQKFVGGRMVVVALGFACGAPFFIAAFLSTKLMVMLPLAFIAVIFINMYNGPLNAIIQDVVPAALRSSASAVVMTLAHLLGDVGSPTFIGWLAGTTGGQSVAHGARFTIAQSLVVAGGPALILGALAAIFGIGVYIRETTHKEGKEMAISDKGLNTLTA
jgi:MFS transporter, Spinster family, sphingosine-1-phosphate transporter